MPRTAMPAAESLATESQSSIARVNRMRAHQEDSDHEEQERSRDDLFWHNTRQQEAGG